MLVLWLVRLDARVSGHRATRWLSGIGRNGCCLYLVHQVALLVAFALLAWLALDLPVRLHFWLRLAAAFALSLILAQLLFRLAERPFRRFRRSAALPR